MSFRIRHLLIITTVIALLLASPSLYERCPGTLYFDSLGQPHGSGTKRHFYDSGALMIEEHYFAGEMTRSVWYRPDQTIVADVIVPLKTETFVGYHLYQNGTVRAKMSYRYDDRKMKWIAHECDCFDSNGKLVRVQFYRDGRLSTTFILH